MRGGVDSGVFPGAVLQVVADNRTVFNQAYGSADLFCGRPMTLDTFFDLASLTKPLATVPAVMVLVQRGQLDLDQCIGDILPDITGCGKERITLRQLLNHSSGLPAWRPFFMGLRNIPIPSRLALLRRRLLAEPFASRPGRKSEYSDLGYMLLQWVVEILSGQSLDQFVSHEIYAPLCIENLSFNNANQPVSGPHQYAATQLCPWRNKLMVGQVDDDNAYVTGGVAGHAGLFGTADAVSRLLHGLLAADRGDSDSGVFNPNLVHAFFEAPPNQRWALGFDTPSPQGSSAGQYFSSRSVGHLGFTGTSFWMHRQKGIIVVLLTNRVHPWRFNPGIKAFRPRLHDAVMRAL
ncbi:MAG: serine hydrolase domain-containing protein [Desulfobacteraceae bacterium]